MLPAILASKASGFSCSLTSENGRGDLSLPKGTRYYCATPRNGRKRQDRTGLVLLPKQAESLASSFPMFILVLFSNLLVIAHVWLLGRMPT